MESWLCSLCQEEVVALGPIMLDAAIDAHNQAMHSDTAPMNSWRCQACGEIIRRDTAQNLRLASTGHMMYHHKAPAASAYYSWDIDGTVLDPQTQRPMKDAWVVPFEPFTGYDVNFLQGILVKW